MQRRTLGPIWGRLAFFAGAVLVSTVAWAAVATDGPVPLLGWVDLFTHEAGHVLFGWAPAPVTAVAGSALQVLVPLLLAWSFLVREREVLGSAICLGWAATSVLSVARYVADAPHHELELIGGTHDWAYLLGQWGALERAEQFGQLGAVLAAAVLLASLSLIAIGTRVQPYVRDGQWPRWPLVPLPRPLPLELAELEALAQDVRLREAEERLEEERIAAGLPSPASGYALGTPVAQMELEAEPTVTAEDEPEVLIDLTDVEFFATQ